MTTATRVSRDDGWGRSTRFYKTPDGLSLPSVTSILAVAPAKPALVNWAAKREREMVMRAAADLNDDMGIVKMPRLGYLDALEKRVGKTKAHTKELEKAGDIGSQVHAKIEWTLKRELNLVVGPEPALQDAALWAFMAWEDWRKQANMVPLAIEQTVWSAKHGYAGTMDLYAELDIPTGGRGRTILDWKSGKAIYSESSLQNAAYIEAMIEMGHATRPTHGMIVRLPKVETDPEFEVKFIPADTLPAHFIAFRAALAIWKWQEAQGK